MQHQTHNITFPDPSSSDEPFIRNVVEIFRKYLVPEWNRKKTPYNIDIALANTIASGSNCTERIFFEAGFKAWLAFFLATSGEGHFDGRQAQGDAIKDFRGWSVEKQKLVALRVAQTVPHSTVQDAIQKMTHQSKRRRLLSSAVDAPAVDAPTVDAPTVDAPAVDAPAVDTPAVDTPAVDTPVVDAPVVDLPVVDAPAVDNIQEQPFLTSPTHSINLAALSHPHLTQSVLIAGVDISSTNANPISFNQQTVFSGGSPQEFARIVPKYMSGAITRDKDGTAGWKVAVTMVFPYVGKVDCVMSLDIQSNKTIYIAMALFGVHVEVDPVVQIVLENGVTLAPSPDVTLQGAQDVAIIKLLGPEIFNGIKTSRAYQLEQKQGINTTRCVSMCISKDLRAVIHLNLGLEVASRIKDKLHRNNEA